MSAQYLHVGAQKFIADKASQFTSIETFYQSVDRCMRTDYQFGDGDRSASITGDLSQFCHASFSPRGEKF